MGLGHEKLDVYRLSIGYVAWVYEQAGNLGGVFRSVRDQWLRASQSIPLNITELDRMAAMLSRLGGRGYRVEEVAAPYGNAECDFDPDPDPDSDFEFDKKTRTR